MKLSTTARCGRTPVVLLALEELELPCLVEVLPEGSFTERLGRMGPVLEDGALTLFEHNAMLRHLARLNPTSSLSPANEAEASAIDQWMDFSLSHLRANLARLGDAMAANPDTAPPPELLALVKRALTVLDAGVAKQDYLLGRFTFADCAFAGLEMLSRLGPVTNGLPSLSAWIERLAARPSSLRVKARRAA